MTRDETDFQLVAAVAYAKAWASFIAQGGQTPDEKASGPKKLRDYIQMMIHAGERDAEHISSLVLGLMRQEEQISRSKASVEMRSGWTKMRAKTNSAQD